MNLKDEEWEPTPTDPSVLRRVRAATKSCVSTHDLANLRAALLAAPFHGAIPHEVRGAVWLLLMRLRAEALLSEDASAFAQNAREAVTDRNSREQIEKDVARTRPGLARFKQPAVRGALLRLLSLFCVRQNVAYVQGFNELLAPFVLLADTGGNPRIVYALFAEFVTRFAPWLLESSESRVFDVLKRMFKYFGRLLLYHDPELYWLLERHMMSPDLYATSWFVTLFARNFTVESVLALWDLLLLEDNPLGTIFFGIALLCSKREILLNVDESRIPETLMMMTANSPEEVRSLWKRGSEMRTVYTPPSFQRLMTDRLLQVPGTRPNVALSAARAMQASVCLQTTPDDLVAGEAHYFTWDCRTAAEYSAGHLAQAAHLPLDALREANGKITNETSEAARMELQAAVDLCEPLKDSSHICLVGSGIREEDNMDINMLALYLTRLGIRYVSTLRGGFDGALKAARSEDTLSSVELVDYDPKRYERARKARISAQAKRSQEERWFGTPRTPASANSTSRNSRAEKEAATSGRAPELQTPESFRNGDDSPEEGSSQTSSADRAEPSLPGIASFLEKTDSEVSRALNKALSGMGFRYSLSSISSGLSGERDNTQSETNPSSTASTPGNPNPFSPSSIVSTKDTVGKHVTQSPSETCQTGGLKRTERGHSKSRLDDDAVIRRSLSSNDGVASKWAKDMPLGGRRSGVTSVENSPRLIETPSHTMTPRPGVQVDPQAAPKESPIRQKARNSPSNFFGAQRSPWGRDARPGWLGDETLSFPLDSMPKGFTVNVMDDRVMAGLRLFPCKARSDRSLGLRGGRANEFKKRYVGVSANYLLLLSPHHNRNHLLEVKLIRYLQDISRITFKRSRPEVVTFEILTGDEEDAIPESVVCLMPDGLKECVALIKEYLAAQGVANAADDSPVSERDRGVDEGNSENTESVQIPTINPLGPQGVKTFSESSSHINSEDGQGGRRSAKENENTAPGATDSREFNQTFITKSKTQEGIPEQLQTKGRSTHDNAEADYMEFGEFQAAPLQR